MKFPGAGENRYQIHCLGEFRILSPGGQDLTPKGRKARALIAYVTMQGAPVSHEKLATLLWGDRAEEQARASLRQALYEVRDLTQQGLVTVTRNHVDVERTHRETDLEQIEQAAAQGEVERLSHAWAEASSSC